MKFGNWLVTANNIEWYGDPFGRFVIPFEELIRTRNESEHVYYDWILLATAEDWLTQNDLFDLNYAFVYAAAKREAAFNYDVFDATLEVQFEQFDEEDNEDVELE